MASLVAILLALMAPACSRNRPANVLLVTIDTLRADHLGFDGYARDTSPTLDRLAGEGTWFPRCYSQSATTGASHATIFTACQPRTHGVRANREKFPDRPSLMSVLRAEGYFTAAFVSSVVVGRKFGVDHLFDRFDDRATTAEMNRPTMAERPAGDTLEAARAVLAARDPRQPFFVWVHLIDPHGPYEPPEDADRFVGDRHAGDPRLLDLGESNWAFREIPAYQVIDGRRDAAYYVARYDAEIRYADGALGRFFDALRDMGVYDDTLIVVTADHGETLDEPNHRRYFSHGTIAYEEVVRVPLIFREARGDRRLAAAARERPVTSMDIAPTILDLLGLDRPPAFEGSSLLESARRTARPIYSMGAYGSDNLEKEIGTQFSIRQGRWHLIVNSLDGTEELYDYLRDPSEGEDVAAREPKALEALKRDLNAFLAGRPAPSTLIDFTPEDLERLRSLGYVK